MFFFAAAKIICSSATSAQDLCDDPDMFVVLI